jgi:hypothetical protein
VPGELEHVHRLAAGAGGEHPVGDEAVQPAALGRADVVVQRVGDDVVKEPVEPVPVPVTSLAGDDVRAQQVVEGRRDGGFGQAGDIGDEADPGEVDGAQHGERVGDGERGRRQRDDPPQHRRAAGEVHRLRRDGEAGDVRHTHEAGVA